MEGVCRNTYQATESHRYHTLSESNLLSTSNTTKITKSIASLHPLPMHRLVNVPLMPLQSHRLFGVPLTCISRWQMRPDFGPIEPLVVFEPGTSFHTCLDRPMNLHPFIHAKKRRHIQAACLLSGELYSPLLIGLLYETFVLLQTGIGTYTDETIKAPFFPGVSEVLDEMFAWNLSSHIKGAHRSIPS